MPGVGAGDWTGGAAKWAAVCVLALASIGGMAWSMFGRGPGGWRAGGHVEMATPVEEPAESPAGDPRRGLALEAPRAPEGAWPVEVRPRLIDLNSATQAELELLPGIGPSLAGRIVEHREEHGPFESVDRLADVPGIGERTVERVRGLVTAG